MHNRLYIDDIDAYSAYGVYLQDGSAKSLVQIPPLKSVYYNDLAEYDGLEVDLASPALESRQVVLSFHITDIAGAQLFLDALTAPSAYHTFTFPRLARAYTFRLVDSGSLSLLRSHGVMTLTFADDNVSIPSTYVPLATPSVPSDGYRLDNVDLARFGCRVMQGTEAQIRRWPGVRQRLRRSSVYTPGATYDADGDVRKRSRELTLNIHLHEDSNLNFWRRYYALYRALTAPEERELTAFGKAFKCYYKSSSVKAFRVTDQGGIWCDFSVTLVVLGYGEAEEIITVRVLGTDDGRILIDNNNNALAISA